MLLARIALATAVVNAELFNPSKRPFTTIEDAQVKRKSENFSKSTKNSRISEKSQKPQEKITVKRLTPRRW